MAIMQFFLATLRHGKKKKKAILKVKYEKSITLAEARKSLRSNLQLQAKVTPASQKVPVYTFHSPMHKRKQM